MGVPGTGPVPWEERARRVKPWKANKEGALRGQRDHLHDHLRGHMSGDWIWQGGSFSERGCDGLKGVRRQQGEREGRQ